MSRWKLIQEIIEEKGYVNAQLISDNLDVSLIRACNILQACWKKGLLLPVNLAFFAYPQEDGGPLVFDSAKGTERTARWYRPEIDAVEDIFEKEPDLAVTVRDMADRLKIHPNRVRKVLYVMVEAGTLVMTEASGGGAFGKPPKIFALRLQNMESRSQQAVEEGKARRKKAKQTRKINEVDKKADQSWRIQEVKPPKPKKALKVDIREEY